jgi:hypothetical protein
MNTIRQRRSSSSTMTASVAVFLLFIMLVGVMRPPASLAASVPEVSPGQLPAGILNVQIQALEVTQGVRGDIPTRTAPGDDLVLMSDNAVHVANRRTVVRVYPWVEAGSGAAVPPLTARLWAYRDGELVPGSPITPVNSHLEGISPHWTLKEMRSDADLQRPLRRGTRQHLFGAAYRVRRLQVAPVSLPSRSSLPSLNLTSRADRLHLPRHVAHQQRQEYLGWGNTR